MWSKPDYIPQKLLRTIKPEQQTNTFCFPTPEIPDKSGDRIPTQTHILNKQNELKETEKLDQDWIENAESTEKKL